MSCGNDTENDLITGTIEGTRPYEEVC